MSIFGNVTAKQVCTLGAGCDAIPDVIEGDICFYYIVDDDKPVTSEYKLIKRISNLASVVTLIEDNRDGDYYGDIGYGIIVTNEMLEITANTGGVQVEGEDNAGDEDDAETPEGSAENEDDVDVII